MNLPKLDKLAAREKVLLFVSAVILLVAMFQYLLIMPFHEKVEETDRLIKETQSLIFKGREKLGSQKDVEEDYEKVKGMLGKSLSDAEAINDVKGQVEDLAQKAGLKFSPAMHRDPVRKEFWREYFVELPKVECGTSMTNLLAFVDQVQQTESMFRVVKVNLSLDKETGLLKGSIVASKIMLAPEEVAAESAKQEPK